MILTCQQLRALLGCSTADLLHDQRRSAAELCARACLAHPDRCMSSCTSCKVCPSTSPCCRRVPAHSLSSHLRQHSTRQHRPQQLCSWHHRRGASRQLPIWQPGRGVHASLLGPSHGTPSHPRQGTCLRMPTQSHHRALVSKPNMQFVSDQLAKLADSDPCTHQSIIGTLLFVSWQVNSTSILFRGLCVRMGIATGVVEGLKVRAVSSAVVLAAALHTAASSERVIGAPDTRCSCTAHHLQNSPQPIWSGTKWVKVNEGCRAAAAPSSP